MADKLYMQRAIELAKLAENRASPNPCVGAVIVYNNKIISEAWHHQFGSYHAERLAMLHAINTYKNSLDILKKSTLYVTMEPCNHYGKTPPCTDIIIKYKIPKVVIGQSDMNPIVTNKGIATLKEAGIKVEVGLLDKECEALNKYYNTYHKQKRPYIIIKWAQSEDLYFNNKINTRYKLTDNFTSIIQHKYRSKVDGVLIGYNTAKIDNPLLTTRYWPGKSPIRIILDKNLHLSNNLNIFDNTSKTLIINNLKDFHKDNIQYVKINYENPYIGKEILDKLYELGIQSIIIEGGRKTIDLFKNANLWDEAHVYTAPVKLLKGLEAPLQPPLSLLKSKQRFINDYLAIYLNPYK